MNLRKCVVKDLAVYNSHRRVSADNSNGPGLGKVQDVLPVLPGFAGLELMQ